MLAALLVGTFFIPGFYAIVQSAREAAKRKLGFAVAGSGGLRSQVTFGPVIGRMESEVYLNLAHLGAPGTGESPIPFDSRNKFTLVDRSGRDIGSFVAD